MFYCITQVDYDKEHQGSLSSVDFITENYVYSKCFDIMGQQLKGQSKTCHQNFLCISSKEQLASQTTDCLNVESVKTKTIRV